MTDCISGYISVGTEQLHYLQKGTGKKLLIAFHGYGNTADIFTDLSQALKLSHICISVDLPHHGKSSWGNLYFTEDHAIALVKALMLQFKTDKVSLLGYSMGGRVCLKLVETISGHIERLVLIASDGLKFNSFYYFLTRTRLGKILFESFLLNPKPYNVLIDSARKLRIVSKMKYNLAMRYIRDEDDRDFLLKVWQCMSYMIPDMSKLKYALTQHNIDIVLYMGREDTIIPVSLGKSFNKHIPTSELIILNKGHRMLDADTIPLITKSILGT